MFARHNDELEFDNQLDYGFPTHPMKLSGVVTLLLAAIPFLAMCFSVPLWDRVYPMVFGLPFNLFWLVVWIPLTSLCMWGVYRLWLSSNTEDASKRSLDEGRKR